MPQRSEDLRVRLTPNEKNIIQAVAAGLGVSMSFLARAFILAYAHDIIEGKADFTISLANELDLFKFPPVPAPPPDEEEPDDE